MNLFNHKGHKEHKGIIIALILCVLCALCGLLNSCVSLFENAGKALDGSNEKILEHYRSENGIDVLKVRNRSKEESILIQINSFQMMKIRGALPNENEELNLTSIEYLGSYPHGWNEYSMAIIGKGKLSLVEPFSFSITDKIELIQITSGRIHRYDTRITGDEAVTALNNRQQRIVSLTEWMSSYIAQNEEKTFTSIEDFEKYWKPILLPETVGNRERPAGWRQENDTFQRAESINWNTGYSERVFPEELNPIRNTGTLLRDWEEALPWIYMEYEWKNIVELLSEDISLTKIK